MADSKINKPAPAQAPEPEAQPTPADESTVAATMERFLAGATASTVFGEPVKDEKGIVISAAEVTVMFGFGLGAAKTPATAGTDANGTGGGGGGYLVARPVATLVVTPMGVRQEPIVDMTKIVLGVLTAAGVLGGLIWRARNGKGP